MNCTAETCRTLPMWANLPDAELIALYRLVATLTAREQGAEVLAEGVAFAKSKQVGIAP